ncbi:VOC family protein [Azotosporobacter soli]|uniref:VOC family protein n=1 Tax=Azotosporobacter soli TaxID=3055040 RepID=UPI0031FED727
MESLTPNLMVANVNETVAFYRDTLGFTLLMSVPETGTFNWAMVQCGKVELMFQERKNLIAEYPMLKEQQSGGALTLYIKVNDVESWYERLNGKVKIVAELHKTFYGTNEFSIQDCNGFILTISKE